jgi:hypothetical protein
MASMLFLLVIPKCYAPQYENDIQSKQRINRLLLRIHAIDQVPKKTPYHRLQKQILVWSLRYLQLPQDQPIVWHLTFIYILALLTLPWFRANFIPSGESNAERYGIFYMWGMVFANEWVPIADTWMLAAEQIVLDVFAFFFLVTWRGTDAADLTCNGSALLHRSNNNSKASIPRQMNEKPWFKGLEAIYWLWRSSELVALASFYGGIWPTLVQNINVYWIVFVGYILGWGKNGVFTKKKQRHRFMTVVEGCLACQDTTSITLVQNEKKSMPVDDVQYLSSASINAITLTQEEEQQKIGFISMSSSNSSGGSSSCNSSTPFDDGLPHIKSRKRQLKNLESL